MSKLNFDYVPLTFISDKQEIKKQIRNTLILIHLFEKYNNPVRLEKLIVGTQYGYNASALQSGNNKFLRISDIHDSKVNWDSVPYCNCDNEESYLLNKEDILIARTGGTTGKSFKIVNPPTHSIFAGYLIRIRAKKEVNPDYVYLFLHSFAYWSQIVNLNERNFRPKANAENLKSLILPDCERKIQDEVVRISNGENIKGYEDLYSKIENVLTEYDNTQLISNTLNDQLSQLENLNQAILQEAVQGKLVKQDPKDEPAIELLKRIAAEKLKSDKKDKPLRPIKPEEIPFEIPENWVWCRLIDIGTTQTGTTPPTANKAYFGHDIPFIKPADISLPGINYENEGLSFAGLEKGVIVQGDSLLMVCIGGSTGKSNYTKRDVSCNQQINSIKGLCGITGQFLQYFLQTPYFQNAIWAKSSGGTTPIVNKSKWESIPVPLPPISEQRRIVAEIEKQSAKTKQLKEHIIANQQATEQLLNAFLHQAFEVEAN
jgi:type I restriction enzyme S subunit